MRTLYRFTLCLSILGSLALAPAASRAEDLLTIGSEAPKLDIEHWLQDGNGKFKEVTDFEKGKVYVVEFWATWCGPCIASMPHLAELQKQYADQGLRIVSVSDEDVETIDKFLDREVRSMEEAEAEEAASADAKQSADESKKTYRDVTSAYSLTTDPDQSVYEDYMVAAAQNGIPTAFLVGKDSKIEWLGHPMELDGPLTAVLNDSWDREAFAKQIREQQEAEKAMQEIFALLQEQKWDEAVTRLDELAAKNNSMQMKMLKLQVLLAAKKSDEAAAHLTEIYKELGDQPQSVDVIAWNIYEMAAQGRIEQESLIETSVTAVQGAIENAKGDEKSSLLDTLSHLQFIQGDVESALRSNEQAIELAGDQNREFIEGFREELQAAQEKAKAAPKTPE